MWQKVSLGEIVKNLDSRRIPLNSMERAKKSSQKLYPYIGANNIKEYISEYIFDEKILCVAEDGGNWGQGQVCAVIYEGKTWVNNHAHVLVENGKAKLEYLRYFLNKADLTKYITGATRGKLTRSALDSIQVPLPPIDQQIAIANILGKAESLIYQRKESLRLLDEFLKSAFLEMFGNPFKNEMTWNKLTMHDVSTQITDGEHTTPIRTESGIKLLSARNIRDGYLDFKPGVDHIGKEEYDRIAKRCKPQRDDILMSCSGSVGRVTVINTDEPLSLVRSVALIKLNKNVVMPLYLQSWMQTDYFQNEIRKGAKTSSQSNIFTGAIRKLPVLVPDLKLQTKFSRIVERSESTRTYYQGSLQQLENLYASLSQMAFKGELQFKPETKVIPFEPDEKEEDYFKKRKALACYIINRSLDDERFGDTKFEKLLNLSDQYAIQRNLGQTYYQKVAGPYDNEFTKLFYIQIAAEKLYKRKNNGKQSMFIPDSNHKKTFTAGTYFSNDELSRVDKLLTYFKKYTYEEPEIISTLYAVWNNRIIRQQQITDEVLKQDFLDWDEKKKRYKDRLDAALTWMRNENIIPNGWGKLIEKPKGKQRKLVAGKKRSSSKRAS